jgi:hypothetical protein
MQAVIVGNTVETIVAFCSQLAENYKEMPGAA